MFPHFSMAVLFLDQSFSNNRVPDIDFAGGDVYLSEAVKVVKLSK